MRKIIFIICLIFVTNTFSQELTAELVLKKAQESTSNTSMLSCNLLYSYYPTYSTTEVLEQYDGQLIKNNSNYFIRINETIFLTDVVKSMALKLNTSEKAMLVSKLKTASNLESPINITTIIKQFKSATLIDNGTTWTCTLTAPQISQLPYSKVEILIDKEDYKIKKQSLFFSTKAPYTDKNKKEVFDNPRLEITISDYKITLDAKEKSKTDIETYISIGKQKIKPSTQYNDFNIIEN